MRPLHELYAYIADHVLSARPHDSVGVLVDGFFMKFGMDVTLRYPTLLILLISYNR